jgi:hypothetical protein
VPEHNAAPGVEALPPGRKRVGVLAGDILGVQVHRKLCALWGNRALKGRGIQSFWGPLRAKKVGVLSGHFLTLTIPVIHWVLVRPARNSASTKHSSFKALQQLNLDDDDAASRPAYYVEGLFLGLMPHRSGKKVWIGPTQPSKSWETPGPQVPLRS